jgi:hypothetical protein
MLHSFPHAARRCTYTELMHTLQERPSAPREPHVPLIFCFATHPHRCAHSRHGAPVIQYALRRRGISHPILQPARRLASVFHPPATPRSPRQPDSPNALLRNTRTNAEQLKQRDPSNSSNANNASRPKQHNTTRTATQVTRATRRDTSFSQDASNAAQATDTAQEPHK